MEYIKNIDILMATYNGEKYIEEQIRSILKQSYQNFNLIISDDCSSDGTRIILENLAKEDNRIKLIFQERNIGIISNFEYLLKKVQNEIFMFADQDDYWKENKIEITLKKMIETNADLVYTDLEVVDENLNTINESYWRLKGLYNKIKKYNNFEALYLNNFITGCTMMGKSKWIKNCLPLPKNSKYILHDYWIALIISQSGKIQYLEEATIKYRQHGDNGVGARTTTKDINDPKEIRKLFLNVKIQHFEVFCENNSKFIYEKYKKLNNASLNYYNNLSKNNKMNISDIKIFFELYRYENFIYKIINFVILHFFCIFNFSFKIFKKIVNRGENNE